MKSLYVVQCATLFLVVPGSWHANESSKPTPRKPGVTVIIVPQGENSPERSLRLFMDAHGGLSDLDFHEVDDSTLRKGLVVAPGDLKKPVHIKLVLSDGKNTTFKTLNLVIEKIRASADPRVTTIVLIYAENLK
jgi:hypothetical protein